MSDGFFFELFPDCRAKQSYDDKQKQAKVGPFNPYKLIGGICSYYHLSFNEVFREMSYQNVMMLSASVPNATKNEKKEEKDESDLTSILENHGK